MRVKELIKKLEKLDQNLKVVLAVDEEGNGFSPCDVEPTVADLVELGGSKIIKAILLYPDSFINYEMVL